MRWVAGFLLVGAAVLKAAQLVTEPAAALLNPLGRYFLPAQIGLELAVGLIFLSGIYCRTLRWLVLLLFTGFASFSLDLALNGAASCGCCGQIQAHPLWTFGLDSLVVLGLFVSVLLERDAQENGAGSHKSPIAKKASSHHRAVAVVMGIAVVCTAVFFQYAGPQTSVAGWTLTSVGDLVILEPEQWIGQTLPIAKSVDLDLSAGDWIVLLHRHDCPVCEEEVPRYEQRASRGERIALVEVPPYGDFKRREEAVRYGRWKEDREWFVQTPVEIRLIDGHVFAAKTHEH